MKKVIVIICLVMGLMGIVNVQAVTAPSKSMQVNIVNIPYDKYYANIIFEGYTDPNKEDANMTQSKYANLPIFNYKEEGYEFVEREPVHENQFNNIYVIFKDTFNGININNYRYKIIIQKENGEIILSDVHTTNFEYYYDNSAGTDSAGFFVEYDFKNNIINEPVATASTPEKKHYIDYNNLSYATTMAIKILIISIIFTIINLIIFKPHIFLKSLLFDILLAIIILVALYIFNIEFIFMGIVNYIYLIIVYGLIGLLSYRAIAKSYENKRHLILALLIKYSVLIYCTQYLYSISYFLINK